MKSILSVVCALSIYISTALAFPEQASKQYQVPGGVAVLPIAGTNVEPRVSFEGNRVLVIADRQHKDKWWAVVGIPLEETANKGVVKVSTQQKQWVEAFEIYKKVYPIEKLTFQQKGKPRPPSQALLDRIERETKLFEAAFSDWQDKSISTLNLRHPLKGRRSGEFGARRSYNGTPGAYHRGVDIAAHKGTLVFAAMGGKVILAGDFFLTGHTVMIDHGQGFKTVYCHLDKIRAKMGEWIHTGQVVGTVGQTGRATGPHLHFGVSLNNARVDPDIFFNIST